MCERFESQNAILYTKTRNFFNPSLILCTWFPLGDSNGPISIKSEHEIRSLICNEDTDDRIWDVIRDYHQRTDSQKNHQRSYSIEFTSVTIILSSFRGYFFIHWLFSMTCKFVSSPRKQSCQAQAVHFPSKFILQIILYTVSIYCFFKILHELPGQVAQCK